ncbi:MAG: dienelactone hydrolase [Colwellia sp.]|jgi:dienelactone hydrolase|tara:strand:+ start:26653 stop:27201 length:549 start_codon:yes stop_codon:yes gene_type:complete
MSIILVSDVFGITPALLKLKDKLGASIIIDPYKGKSMAFNNETEAYSCFINTVGLDSYVSKVLKTLVSLNNQTTLIGFSVGASAIWRLPIKNEDHIIKQAFCFYGSQIRNFTKIEPCFKIHLVFPKSESHFDVSKLKKELTKKQNVITTQVEYLHGFMNYYSSNFNQIGYDKHVALLRSNAS